jgi:hypothetical protein
LIKGSKGNARKNPATSLAAFPMPTDRLTGPAATHRPVPAGLHSLYTPARTFARAFRRQCSGKWGGAGLMIFVRRVHARWGQPARSTIERFLRFLTNLPCVHVKKRHGTELVQDSSTLQAQFHCNFFCWDPRSRSMSSSS